MDDLDSLTVAELKQQLKELGLPSSMEAELIARVELGEEFNDLIDEDEDDTEPESEDSSEMVSNSPIKDDFQSLAEQSFTAGVVLFLCSTVIIYLIEVFFVSCEGYGCLWSLPVLLVFWGISAVLILISLISFLSKFSGSK